ncbi:MAG: hypothetical protein NTZ09_09530 [Candidatus Hydrogenedentes bacterium]|nr:hypothetical protein [Candidatus Hydrogenedentota bacterium]
MHASSTPPPAKSAFDLVEEAFHLVRRLPLHDLAAYYIGTLPFLAGLLYFWVDMTHHSVPESRVLLEALGVTLLFIWMKIWQVSYARRLWRLVAVDQPAAAVVAAPARWAGMIGRQTMIHASGLVALPVALVFAGPFGAVYAFYQNATILEDMTDDLTGLQRRAMKMAAAWPRQNHLLIWSLSPVLLVAAFAIYVVLVPIMSAVTPEWSSLFLTIYSTIYLLAILPLTPFAVVTALNIATVLIVLPHLIKMLTGTPLLFLTNSALILNSFFMAVVCALTWCALDPIIKAAYLLRCFYLASLLTGEDLRAQLARYARVLVVAAPLLFVLASAPAVAAPEIDPGPAESAAPALEVQPAVAPGELDRAIDVVMAGSEYDWRLPRQPNEGGIVSKFFMQVAETLRHWAEVVGHWLDKLGDWLSRRLSRGGDDEAGGGGASTMQVVLYVAWPRSRRWRAVD